MDDKFDSFESFSDYLAHMGWVSKDNASSVKDACAAFEMIQRHKGIDVAKEAMLKAADRAR